MKNPYIPKMLKYHRKLNQLSVQDVSECFAKNNNFVAAKTIYGWESGQTQPSADNLLFLCELYQIQDVLETFGYTKEQTPEEPFLPTHLEKELILSYRRAPHSYQSAVRKLLDLEPSDH